MCGREPLYALLRSRSDRTELLPPQLVTVTQRFEPSRSASMEQRILAILTAEEVAISKVCSIIEMLLRYGPDGRTPWNDDSTFGPVGQTSRSTVGVAVIAPQHHWLLGPDPPSTSVHSPAIHLMTLGVNFAAVCRLETLTALV